MRRLTNIDFGMLVLAAMQPISYLPETYLQVAERLVQQGLMAKAEGRWCATSVGRAAVGLTAG